MGGNEWTNKRTNGMTNKSPPVFYRTSSPMGQLPKKSDPKSGLLDPKLGLSDPKSGLLKPQIRPFRPKIRPLRPLRFKIRPIQPIIRPQTLDQTSLTQNLASKSPKPTSRTLNLCKSSRPLTPQIRHLRPRIRLLGLQFRSSNPSNI